MRGARDTVESSAFSAACVAIGHPRAFGETFPPCGKPTQAAMGAPASCLSSRPKKWPLSSPRSLLRG